MISIMAPVLTFKGLKPRCICALTLFPSQRYLWILRQKTVTSFRLVGHKHARAARPRCRNIFTCHKITFSFLFVFSYLILSFLPVQMQRLTRPGSCSTPWWECGDKTWRIGDKDTDINLPSNIFASHQAVQFLSAEKVMDQIISYKILLSPLYLQYYVYKYSWFWSLCSLSSGISDISPSRDLKMQPERPT